MIVFCLDDEAWNPRRNRPQPGTASHRQIASVAAELGARIVRQPIAGAVNVITNGVGCYEIPDGARLVQSGHGISDKGNYHGGWLCHACLVPNAYIAARVGGGSIPLVAGVPYLDPVFRGEMTPAPPGRRPRVLYAPTLSDLQDGRHVGYSSRLKADEIRSALAPYDVTFSDHPRYARGRITPLQAYLDADVIVADYGSTISLGVILGKPVVVAPVPVGPEPDSIEDYLGQRVRRADTIADLPRLIDAAVEHGPLPAETDASPVVLDPDLRGTSTQATVQHLRDLEERWASR